LTKSEGLGESQFGITRNDPWRCIEVDRDRAVEISSFPFHAHSISEAVARQTPEVMLTSDAMGKHPHSLMRLPQFIRDIEHSNANPDGTFEIANENGG
jgi:LDH2 family malate/lactate/ureidoglycolate dehydrogenase